MAVDQAAAQRTVLRCEFVQQALLYLRGARCALGGQTDHHELWSIPEALLASARPDTWRYFDDAALSLTHGPLRRWLR
jgi:hypothetical protein